MMFLHNYIVLCVVQTLPLGVVCTSVQYWGGEKKPLLSVPPSCASPAPRQGFKAENWRARSVLPRRGSGRALQRRGAGGS